MTESQRRAAGKIPALLEMEESTLAKAVRRISGGLTRSEIESLLDRYGRRFA
jgi:hypothetical protein